MEYVPGQWKSGVKTPLETQDEMNGWTTFKVQYPPREDFYFDLTPNLKQHGAPFHNVSDVMRQYSFEGVEKMTLVVVG